MQLTTTTPRAPSARRLVWWRLLAIIVSFAHMWTTIGLFGAGSWYGPIVAGGMTLLIDLAIYEEIEYLLLARLTRRRVSGWHTAFLALAIILSIALQAGYLWTHRPAAMPAWLAGIITAALAVFVPGWIAIAAVMQAETTTAERHAQAEREELARLRAEAPRLAAERDRLRAERDATRTEAEALRERAERTAALESQVRDASATFGRLRAESEAERASAAQLRDEVAHLRAEAARLMEEAAHHRAETARAEPEIARLARETARLDDDLAQARAVSAQSAAESAHLRAQLARLDPEAAQLRIDVARLAEEAAQLRAERDTAQQAAQLDPRALAVRLADEQLGSRAIARVLGHASDSTIRGWLKARPERAAA